MAKNADQTSTQVQFAQSVRLQLKLVKTRRDLVLLYGAATVLVIALWIIVLVWFPFDSFIPFAGTGVLLLNGSLSLVFLRKDTIITQALAATAGTIQILLIIFVIRTGSLGS